MDIPVKETVAADEGGGGAIGGTRAAGAVPKGATIKRLLREPLVHFLAVALVVIGAYKFVDPALPPVEDTSRHIEITEDDLRQMAVAWLAQGRPTPTPDEMSALVDEKVTSEVLVREAIALGLDKDDEIIKRRLAQKMDFLIADVAAMAPPTDEELTTWFEENSERFALPPRVSFRHLYFSPDRRGAGARDAAAASLPRIAGLPPESPEVTAVADPFMFRNYYSSTTPEQMAREFGVAFSDALFRLEPGSWQGPVESGYGWHLVWVDSLEPGRIPTYEEVAAEVLAVWQQDRYREVKERAIAEMRSRYTVVVPPLDELNPGDLVIPQAALPEVPGS